MLHHIYTILWGENGLSSETKVTQKKSISAKVINKFIKPLNAHNEGMNWLNYKPK